MRKTALLVVFLTVFIDLLGFGMVLPLLPLYGKELAGGLTDMQRGIMLGLLMSSFSVMQFFFAPVWGRLSDRVGRRPILMLGLAGSVVFYSLFGVASVQASLLLLFISRIGAGIFGATITTARAYIADVTTPEKRTAGMALIGAAFGLGFTFGPLFGLLAIGEAGVAISPWPGYGAAILSLLAFLMALGFLPESLKPDSQAAKSKVLDLAAWSKALAIPSVGLLLLTSFLYVFCFATLEVILSLFLKEHYKFATKELLLVFTYIGLVLFFVQMGFVRRISKRVSEGVLSIGGSLVMVGGFLLLALMHDSEGGSQVVLFIGLAVVVCGFSCMRPAINSLISRRTDPAQQGTVMGVTDSVQSLSRIVGPLVGLPLYHAIVVGPLYLGAILMGVGILLLKVAVGRGKDFEPDPQEELAGQIPASGE
ncbi:MAG: MFS transporter [Planctomycetota bacterium]|nr:MFS transporter [Planctomycetota bacterium]